MDNSKIIIKSETFHSILAIEMDIKTLSSGMIISKHTYSQS